MASYVEQERERTYKKAFRDAEVSYVAQIRGLEKRVNKLEQQVNKFKCNEELLHSLINFLVGEKYFNNNIKKYEQMINKTKSKRIKKKYIKKILDYQGDK